MKRRYRRRPPKQVSGGDMFFKPTVQQKLKVGRAGDAYEMEADAMADKVVNTTESSKSVQKMDGTEEEVRSKPLSDSISAVQRERLPEHEPVRKMEEEEAVQPQAEEEEEPVQLQEEEEEVQMQSEEQEEPLQMAENEEEAVQMVEEEEQMSKEDEQAVREMKDNGEIPIQHKLNNSQPSILQRVTKEKVVFPKSAHNSEKKSISGQSLENRLQLSKGKGNMMEDKIRLKMETRFGSDFSGVRIHTDDNAVQMSSELGAQAFTHGKDIYFNEGKYNPNSKEGQHLLAHELTHTLQQNGNEIKRRNPEPEFPTD